MLTLNQFHVDKAHSVVKKAEMKHDFAERGGSAGGLEKFGVFIWRIHSNVAQI